MKAAPFAYVRPSSLSDAVAELTATSGEGKVIAGGQSLTPVLAMRLARPQTLIDITAVPGLDRISVTGGVVEIGATVRQRRVERDPACSAVPLLRAAMPWVGHREIRSRGTVCGSLTHADPAAELPAVASCVDADVVVAGPGGSRTVRAREFFASAMMTALGQDEIVTAVRFPAAAPGEGFGFAEIARRHGDFALAGVAARVRLDGETVDAVLTGFGISDRPVTRGVSDELTTVVRAGGSDPGRMVDDLRDALSTVVNEMVDTDGDAHGSRDYRRRLFRTLAARELSTAYHRARSDIDEVNE